MSYTIQPSSDGTYIILTITGNITRSLAVQYNREAHGIGQKLGVNKYLVDLIECRNIDNILENYDFAYDDMQHTPDIDRFACVAVLVSPDDHSHDFIETVARNAGLNVTLFTQREQAVEHLYNSVA